MVLDVAIDVVVQLAFDVIITVTWSPLERELVVKVGELVPAFTPFICHWYDGVVPPFVGVAVNVIGFPEQIVVVVAVIFTEGVTEFTVTVAVAELEHPPKE